MTTRATFGDFATAASMQLTRAAGPPGPGGKPAVAVIGHVEDFTGSLRRLLTVMTRYSADIEAAFAGLRPADRRQQGPWLRASSRSREALHNAATCLQAGPAETAQPGRGRPPAPAARGLDAAAVALTTGRDLLHTHLATGPGGGLLARTEWAPVIASAPVTRALLYDVASWARQIAPLGGQLAVARAPVRGTGEARWQLNAACQWLWVLDWAVQAACEHDPVPAADIQLLHAIPASALAPRHRPDGTEPVTRLCQGTIDTAERVRRHARAAVPRASWSPALTMESLRETATYATVISHNCQILLRTLTTSAAQRRTPGLSTQLAEAADAAGNARQAWLRAARAWDPLITDTRGTISPATVETADLALWTGRLAYADPAWTPDLGPSHAHRPPEHLAPAPADLADVVAAVHHAWETLTQLAGADHSQIRTASLTGRLLLPTRSLPETFDVLYAFGPAPGFASEPLLGAYRDARTASIQATGRTAAIADTIRAPSQTLTTASAAIQLSDGSPAANKRQAPEPAARPRPEMNLPGPLERILHDLGVTSPDALQRATTIDHAAEQLILETAQQPDPCRPHTAPRDLSRSASTAEIINHLLATGDPRTAALLHPREPSQSAQAEIEP